MRRSTDSSSDRGAALVEFGLLVPVFLGLFIGIVTTGLAFFARLNMTSAAQEAARVLYFQGTTDAARQAALGVAPAPSPEPPGYFQVHVGTNAVTGPWTPVPSTGWKCTTAGTYVRVTMTRPMPINLLVPVTTINARARAVTPCRV